MCERLIRIGFLLLFTSTPAFCDEWTFDGPFGHKDEAEGRFRHVEGVVGKGLLFDGLTTSIRRKADHATSLFGAFTVEAWAAPQEYPWNWCGLVGQARGREAGWFFGLNHAGRIGLHASIGGEWQECVSEHSIPLLKWSLVTGVFDPEKGMTLYINGRLAGSLFLEGAVAQAEDADLLIGMSPWKMYPHHTEREPSRRLLSRMIFDGIMDEVKIHDRAMTDQEIRRSYLDRRPDTEQPLSFRSMPSGPEGTGGFGARYLRLEYCDSWDALWRVGPHPDIVVTFDDSPVRVVFWRGTSYGPAWVSEKGLWMADQSLESWSDEWGCCEHMSDKQCRYSHVRLIENHDARVVIHWRYALCDITYGIVNPDEETGWGDWADEYYTIYPDCTAVRYQVLWSTNMEGNWHQFQETILFNQPGYKPQDTVEYEALTLANMKGESRTYSWREGYPETYDGPEDSVIQMINFKSKWRPYTIFEEGSGIYPFPFGALEGYSTFPCWNHWPVAQLPNDGRNAPAPDRPSHTSLTGGAPRLFDGEGISTCAVSLYGMTDEPVEALVPLARSWNMAPPLRILEGDRSRFEKYDKTQRAYVFTCSEGHVEFEAAASSAAPLVNPAFLVRNWGEEDARIKINDEVIEEGRNCRIGHRHRLEGSDLIVWLAMESTKPVILSLEKAAP